jgi:preprotein translocase subunit SecG
MLYSILIGVDVIIAATLIGLVLIQQGKGASAGAAFGGGASGTVFGSRGSATFLTKATALLATSFFLITLALAYLASNQVETRKSVTEGIAQEPQSRQVLPSGDIPLMEEIEEMSGKAIPDADEVMQDGVDTMNEMPADETGDVSSDGNADTVVEPQSPQPADIPQ